MQPSRNTVRTRAGFLEQRGPGTQIVALDFETYYDTDYTLRKLSTSEYVRDARFAPLSVAIKIDKGPTKFFFGVKAIKAALADINWTISDVLCHHTHFDGLILTHWFGVRPRYYRDTLSMGRGLHPKFERNSLEVLAAKYGAENKLEMPDFKGMHEEDILKDPELMNKMQAYNVRDVDSMWEIYEQMIPKIPQKELDLIDITVRMFVEPILELDSVLAEKELKREIRERAKAIKSSGAMALAKALKMVVKPKKKGDKITDEQILGSPKYFPPLLQALGIDPPMKISKYNGKPTYALSKADEDFTDLLGHPNEAIVALVRGRLAAKSTIGETRAARLLRSGADGKRLPIYYNYCGAHTMRWSGGDKLNYQNLKKKGDIRKAIEAPEGFQLCVIDSKTIEVRVLAWIARELWLLDAFRKGLDPYIEFGSDMYGFRINAKDHKLERFISKSAVLGLGFQMGGPKFQVSVLAGSIAQGLDPVRLDLPVCYGVVNKYRAKNVNIENFWGFMNDTVLAELVFGKPGVMNVFHDVIEYGHEYMGLIGNLGLHYPEASARVTKHKASAWSRNSTKLPDKINDGSYRTPKGRSKLYGGLLTENIVQYLARHVVAEQMLEISKRYRVVMMTHDEVVFLVKTKEAPEALAWGLKVFRTPPVWAPDMPLDAEGGYDSVYSK